MISQIVDKISAQLKNSVDPYISAKFVSSKLYMAISESSVGRQRRRSVLKRGGAHIPLSHTYTPTQALCVVRAQAIFTVSSVSVMDL